MLYFLYILKSVNHNRYYIGQSSNLQDLLQQHNSKKVFSTKPFSPWVIIYSEKFNSRTEAIKREHFLKSPAGWMELTSIKLSLTAGVAGSPDGTPSGESRHSDK